MRPAPCLLAVACACVLVGGFAPIANGEPAWTTYHRDSVRSGYDPDGSSPLTPAFAWQSQDLGAPVWSQPLVLGSRTYVATVANKLYALDSATGAVVWVKTAGPPVPSSALPCGDIEPTVGIVGTPVIDPGTNTIYAVADVWDALNNEAHHELVGYSLASSEQVLRTRIDPPGEGRDYLQRPGLNLDGANVIVGMGGNDGDCGTYRGTIFSVPETGAPASFWQVPIKVKTNSGGAVWGTSGPAVDGEGKIVASTGNPNPAGGEKASVYDYSDSLIELSPALGLLGWFEPPSWKHDSNTDTDLGSAGPELLPGGLVFQAGKNGTGYLVNQATMSGGPEAVFSAQVCGGAASFGGDAYLAGVIYVACSNGVQALAYSQAARTFSPIWKGPSDAAGPPIVSAGLVWVLATHAKPANKVYGLDPASGAPRYTEILPSSVIDHFASPSAAGGRLFIASGATVTAFQIAVPPPGSPPIPPGVPPILPGQQRGSPTATLLGASAVVDRLGRFIVRVRCPRALSICRGTITVRTLRAVIALGGLTARGRKPGAAILTLATGRFSVTGGQVKAVTLRMGPKARRLLLRKRVLHARATLSMRSSTGALQTSNASITLRLARRH
jgi:outer membrane protein assembly factor BamB